KKTVTPAPSGPGGRPTPSPGAPAPAAPAAGRLSPPPVITPTAGLRDRYAHRPQPGAQNSTAPAGPGTGRLCLAANRPRPSTPRKGGLRQAALSTAARWAATCGTRRN